MGNLGIGVDEICKTMTSMDTPAYVRIDSEDEESLSFVNKILNSQ